VNGQSLAGITLPGKTMVAWWRWERAIAPERRITATVQYAYLATWAGFDTED